MQLSLSVRIAESFLSKEQAEIDLPALAAIAHACGYQALCMRASQIGVHTGVEARKRAWEILAKSHLSVSMITGDFDIVYNNDRGPACLRHIGPYLELAQQMQAPMLRVAIKTEEDIPWAQRAADEAAKRGLALVHQCHTLSLFETVDSIEKTLRAIDRPNFGIIYEPANLELCGQDYRLDTIERLAPWIFNVYLQNQRLHEQGAITLDTWCRGPVRFDLIPIQDERGIDFRAVFNGLRQVGYTGTLTVHQSATEGQTPQQSAGESAEYVRQIALRTGLAGGFA
jgi:sugar phosphate isomerase/epimerase